VEPAVVLFIRASLVWLVAGVTLGVAMAASPALIVYRATHIHFLLLGFVTGMIFGVGYHVFPRFAGRALRHPRLMMVHWWLGNAGVGAMGAAFALRASGVTWSPALLAAGGSAAAAGAYLFAWNVWRTLDRPVPRPRPSRLPILQE
jgi:cbb3-type cytochrome oxidase subunit 1